MTSLAVIVVTAGIIAVGRFMLPETVNTIYPNTPSAPAPLRPSYGALHHLDDPSPSVRLKTIPSLAKLNPGNSHVFRKIANCLREDTDMTVRLEAARAIAASQPLRELLPTLIEALDDENPEVRQNVIKAIANFGPDARSAVPALQMIANSDGEDDLTRRTASEAITLIEEESSADLVGGSVQEPREH